MITPRRTRLVRVSDLHQFRQAIVALCAPGGVDLLVVPTGGAAQQLRRVLVSSDTPPLFMPACVTRDQLYDALHARLVAVSRASGASPAPRRLTLFERDAIAQASASEAAAAIGELPFQIRPGLVSEMLRFYDHLRRQSQHVRRFEELINEDLINEDLINDAPGGDLAGADAIDRGSARLRRQTRFLAAAFLAYERRVTETGACDEHVLRDRLLAAHADRTARHVVVTVPDWIADPAGLFVADFDMLARLPGLEAVDIVCTESILESGFHQRIHGWWPGLEEVGVASLVKGGVRVRPTLSVPAPKEAGQDCFWFTHRDREEELVATAARLNAPHAERAWDRIAVVFKRPLPYLYLAPRTLGAAGIPYRTSDALPLAAEPVVATVDLILDALETRFTRQSLVALLGSPHLDFVASLGPTARDSIGRMNRELSARRYLGGADRLEALAADASFEDAGPALRASRDLANDLAPLVARARASRHIGHLRAFLERHFAPLDDNDALAVRERPAREALLGILASLASAHEAHYDPIWTIEELAAAVRRSIGEETFPSAGAPPSSGGVHLIDDQAARYGDFDDITIVGLVEGEWPERSRRNIFYQPRFLKALGWPSEKDRRRAADARFLDLLASARQRVELSTFTLDDEMLVTRSIQLDEVARARLSSVTRETDPAHHPPAHESAWEALRSGRSPADLPAFHGSTGPVLRQPWSVSALETYITCPFRFFAQHILKLEEEPDDEEVMDPRRQGQFVHEVFAAFFEEWQRAGHGEIASASLPAARELFARVVDRALEALSEGEAGLERTRLLGSPAAAGLGEAVFRMEAERPVAVVERRLEHPLKGSFVIATASGPRTVELRGKADRIDLLADGTFRLIDYKLGWPPNRSRALQLPIYSLCAEQRLAGYRGQRWTLAEAVYLAFKGPRRVVPLFTTDAARADVLAKAQQRLSDTIDAIERGEFPPSPEDVYHCETCAFTSVCRKDYVGDV